MKKINESWHKAHPMPKNPSLEQRIAWHLEHQQNCGCRPMPQNLQAELTTRNNERGQNG